MTHVFFRIPEDSNLRAERPGLLLSGGCFPLGTLPRAALMTPSSPGCSQTPLFLGFLEPARPGGVSST